MERNLGWIMPHCFNPDLAICIGLPSSIVFQQILDGCHRSRRNENASHCINGVYGWRVSVRELREHMPYLTEPKITAAIKLLIRRKLIIKINNGGTDRTPWYAIIDTNEAGK